MDKVIHRNSTRGGGDHGWLKTRYSFSFADWHDPHRMGFGKLRVLNDDSIAPASGFDMHSHRDMEIVTIVTKGAVTHKDNMGNTGTVPAGDIQIMSAGTGVVHGEFNDSEIEQLELFQIWIEPAKIGIAPRYAQQSLGFENKQNGLTLLVAPDGDAGALNINQDAYISYGILDSSHPITYSLKNGKHGVYIFVIDGEVAINDDKLNPRDAIGLWNLEKVEIQSPAQARFLLLEVPVE